jgi:hypothetical protein
MRTHQPREHVINIRLSKAESETLRQLAAGELLTVSDFIRRRCLLNALGRGMSQSTGRAMDVF